MSAAQSQTPVLSETLSQPIPAANGGGNPLRVALVNMPFNSTRYPSMQLGFLQAVLAQHAIPATTHYLNLHFAAHLGWEPYEVIATHYDHLLGEWIFAGAAFGDGAPEPHRFLDTFTSDLGRVCSKLGRDTAYLLQLRREEAPAFIEHCLTAVPWEEYDVAGFSSVFEQNCAALALARRLKERYPRLITVFGGANFEDEMGLEYVRALPWIDYAVIGEGDEVFPALLQRLAAGEEGVELPGVARRGPGGVKFPGRPPLVRDLDSLPEPDYRDYFTTAADLKLPGTLLGSPVVVPFESARGCWWGQKHHCTFCGLNALGMSYRSKSPARMLAGLHELARRYNVYTFAAVDNILDHRYIRELFGPLAQGRYDYNFFYEVKTNLTAEQLRAMARGGVQYVQPGIESLSTHVLRLMRKGTTAIQNVRLLKWAAYYGIRAAWNVLLGFPGELPEDYDRQLATMRLIPHLEPPSGCTRIWLERFSPNYAQSAELGIFNVRAERAYACIYPRELDADRIAYFFDYDAPATLPDAAHEPLREYLRRWQKAWNEPQRPYLAYMRGAGRLTVLDGRQPEMGRPEVHIFDEPAALAYEFCSPTDHGVGPVLAHLRERGLAMDEAGMRGLLDELTTRGLMLEEDGHFLSLALPTNPTW